MGDVWNPTTGCTRVSAGCDNCYAFALHDHRYKVNLDHARAHGESSAAFMRLVMDSSSFSVDADQRLPFPKQYDRPFSQVQILEERLDAPLRRRKPTCYFVDSMSDLFHEDVPDEYLDRVFLRMALNRRHRFLILTKRPERMSAYCRRVMPSPTPEELDHVTALTTEAERAEVGAWARQTVIGLPEPPPNIWLGTSVEDQASADERIPHLIATPAAVRFLSCEPLLGPVDLTRWTTEGYSIRTDYGTGIEYDRAPTHALDWVIVGGESGPRARPMDLAWARSLVEQCRAAGVTPFVKQLGSFPVWPSEVKWPLELRESHGREMTEWPEDLRIREWPSSGSSTSTVVAKQELQA
jgi:protein gp37